MTDTEQPSQWAMDLLEAVSDAGDMGSSCGAVNCPQCAKAALALQRAFTEREAELVGKMRSIMAHFDYDHGNAPGHGHLNAGIWDKDVSNGVMGGTECGWCAEWNDMRAALKSREAGHG